MRIATNPTLLTALAALSLAGPALAAVDLDVTVDPVAQPLYLGDITPITLHVTNTGTTNSVGTISIYVASPLEMRWTQMPAGCVSRTAPGTNDQFVDCPVPALTAGASTTLSFMAEAIALYETAVHAPLGGPDLRVYSTVDYDDGSGTVVREAFPNGSSPFYIDPKPALPPTANVAGPSTAPVNTPFTLTGTTTNVPDGTVLTITVGGTPYQVTVTGNQFSLPLPGMPAGTYPVTVAGPTGLTVSGVNQITVTAAPNPGGTVSAVPTLEVWGLGALAAMLGAVGMRRKRRASR